MVLKNKLLSYIRKYEVPTAIFISKKQIYNYHIELLNYDKFVIIEDYEKSISKNVSEHLNNIKFNIITNDEKFIYDIDIELLNRIKFNMIENNNM